MVMLGDSSLSPAGCGLEQLAQFRGAADLAVMERSMIDTLPVIGQAHEKWPGGSPPCPTLRRQHDIENAERHGRPLRRSTTRIRLAFCRFS